MTVPPIELFNTLPKEDNPNGLLVENQGKGHVEDGHFSGVGHKDQGE